MQNDDFRRAIDAIKLRAPIEDVVRERVPTLKKRGSLWEACCPFHEERTPSFKVDPRRGTWHCFGACGTGGDQFGFLQRFDNIDFLDAAEILAARTGLELPRRTGARAGESQESAKDVLAVLEHATRFYRAQLRTAEGQIAARYLRDRGLSDATGEAFGIGYAPQNGQSFVTEARDAKLASELVVKAGLVRRTDEGRPYDFFRGRLMIPIRDLHGRTVGFGARRLTDDDASGPKYVNTADTELFHKGRLIYALDRALPEVRKTGRIVLVEGYTDVMAAHQCGVPTVVAVLGTATTDDHAALIRRTGARKISLVFDGDEAGRKAAYKALHGLLPLEVEIEVVWLPGGDDPCDLCVREGGQAFLAQLEMARGWFDFLCEGVREKRGAELSREVDRVLELLSRISKPVHRAGRIAELARFLQMPVQAIEAQYAELPVARAAQRASAERGATSADPRSARGTPGAGGVTSRDPRGANAPSSSAKGASRPRDPQLVRCFEEMLGAVLLDVSTYPLVRPYLERCDDVNLDRIFTAIGELYADESATIDESSVLTALAGESAASRIVPIVARVRSVVVEDYTAKRHVIEQIQYIDRIDQTAQKRAIQMALSEREREVMRDGGEQRAATDPVVLENARRLFAPNGAEPIVEPRASASGSSSSAPSSFTPRAPEAPLPRSESSMYEDELAPTDRTAGSDGDLESDEDDPSDHFFERIAASAESSSEFAESEFAEPEFDREEQRFDRSPASTIETMRRSSPSHAEYVARSSERAVVLPFARWFESEGVPSVPTHVQDSIHHG